jgi:hypothetical protein
MSFCSILSFNKKKTLLENFNIILALHYKPKYHQVLIENLFKVCVVLGTIGLVPHNTTTRILTPKFIAS